jgi:two-component system sensor histidine kinase VicK
MHDCKLAITFFYSASKCPIGVRSKMSGKDVIGESAGAPSTPPSSSLENYDVIKDVSSSSSHYEEKTELIYGGENVTNFVLRVLDIAKKTLDLCGDRYGPSIILANEQVMQKYIDLHNRGVRQRVITEITPENIAHCKKLMKFQELRHLDGLKGYLAITDGRYLSSHAYGQEGKVLPHMVVTTVRIFVEQQQYFFETLWNKAIPAKQRIKEIEKGAKREFVETIRDLSEIQKLSFDLIKSAEEEIFMLFSTADAFRHQEKAGVLKLLKEAASPPRNVRIRILIPTEERNRADEEGIAKATMTNETIQQLKKLGIDVRRSGWQQKQQQQNILQNDSNLTLMIVDQSLSLTVELNDDAKETFEEDAIGLATYSNIDSTTFAHISIFENLWMQTEVE